MAFVAQGNQIIRGIPTDLAAFFVMDVQFDAILIDTTALTGISIPPEDVLAYIVLPIHLASLVVLTFRNSFPIGNGLQKLEIELCSLNNYLADG